MPRAPEGFDYFDKARAASAALLVAAGAAAVIGSVIDWVNITELPAVLPPAEAEKAVPFTGTEAGDGWITLGAGIVVVVAAVLLVTSGRGLFAGIALVAAIVIGAIAIADYRGIEELHRREMDRVGSAEVGFGLVLVAASAVAGVIGSVMGLAASPHSKPDEA